MGRWLFSLVLFVGLSGCVSKTKNTSPSAQQLWKPVQLLESRVDTSVPMFEAKGEYSLPALIELGVTHNPQTRVAWWQARKALAQQGRVESSFFPTVSVNVEAVKKQVGATSTTALSVIESAGPSLNVTYRLFQFGTSVANAKSAACALAAANYQFNHTLQLVVCNIQKNYYNYASAVASIEAREASLADAKASFESVQNKQIHGLARAQDVLLAKADALQAEYELKSAQADLERSRAELALSVGVPVSKDFTVKIAFNDHENLTEEVDDLLNKALKQRADLLAVKSTLHAADWAYLKAQREVLPAVDFAGSMGTVRYRRDGKWQQNYTAGIGISWDLFSGFDQQYKDLEYYSELKRRTYDFEQQQLQVLRDVWAEFHAFQSSVQLLSSAKALEVAAKESLEAIRIGYEAGLNNLLDLLSAQKTLSEARLKRIYSQAQLATHWVQLAYVTGRLSPESY